MRSRRGRPGRPQRGQWPRRRRRRQLPKEVLSVLHTRRAAGVSFIGPLGFNWTVAQATGQHAGLMEGDAEGSRACDRGRRLSQRSGCPVCGRGTGRWRESLRTRRGGQGTEAGAAGPRGVFAGAFEMCQTRRLPLPLAHRDCFRSNCLLIPSGCN